MFNGKIHYKLPFSIAMLNYQRVTTSQIMSIMDNPHLFCCLKHNKFYQAPPITSHDFHGQINKSMYKS